MSLLPEDESFNTRNSLMNIINENEESTLWDQMGTRERRAAALSAGMRLGDWESQRDLENALRESQPVNVSVATSGVIDSVAVNLSNLSLVVRQNDDSELNLSSLLGVEEAICTEKTLPQDFGLIQTKQSVLLADLNDDIMLTLPSDVLFRIMLFLDPETVAQCGMVHRAWNFARDDKLYEYLCRRIYTQQSKRNVMFNITRWRSWRRMMAFRPRLRTQGLYVLRHSHIKTPQIDMFTEWKRGVILECIYYRVLRFEPYGICTYVLTAEGPKEAARLLWMPSDLKCSVKDPYTVASGEYTIKRNEVDVTVQMQHAIIGFKLLLGSSSGRGSFTQLDVLEHYSVDIRNPNGGLLRHKVNTSESFVYTTANCP